MLGVGLSVVVTATSLAGCADQFEPLTTPLTEDTDKIIMEVPLVKFFVTDEGYFVTFLGHRDNGIEYGYVDHKDYTITYSISREDYLSLMKAFKNDINSISNTINNSLITRVKEKVQLLEDIIKNYDPISVEDYEGQHVL